MIDPERLKKIAREIYEKSFVDEKTKQIIEERYKYQKTQARLRQESKKRLVKIFGGECMVCGYKKSLSALEFHHIDEQSKDFELGNNVRDEDKLLKEAEKCILVCSNCHREIHYPCFIKL